MSPLRTTLLKFCSKGKINASKIDQNNEQARGEGIKS